MSAVGSGGYNSVFPAAPLTASSSSSSAAAASVPGKPRPFLDGVFKTACNFCVRSKRGCSGGQPCDHCRKRGKTCVYAQRRKSGPRSRPASAAQLSKSRAKPKARRESISVSAALAADPAFTSTATPWRDGDRRASWIGYSHGDGYAVVGSNDNGLVWEQRRRSYPQYRQQHHHHKQEPMEPATEPDHGPGDDWQPLRRAAQTPLTSTPRRDTSGLIGSHQRIESLPWDLEAGHQLQTLSPLAPARPIRSVSVAAAAAAAVGVAGARPGVDGHGRRHGSTPLHRASSEDPSGTNKRTRLSLARLPPGSPSTLPRRSISTAFHSGSISSLGARGAGVMSRWIHPPGPASSHPTDWAPEPFSGTNSEQRGGGGGGGGGSGPVLPVTAAMAAPAAPEVEIETAKAAAPPIAKGVLDRVPSFPGYGAGAGDSSGAAEGPFVASSWAAIAAMAVSCVGEGRDRGQAADAPEASFGSMFPLEKQEEGRLQFKLEVQQLRLEQKEQQLRKWQEQLEQKQQQQQNKQQQEEERPSTKRQLSLGKLLMDEDGEVRGLSKQDVGTSLALTSPSPAMPAPAASAKSCAGGRADGGGSPPTKAPFATYPLLTGSDAGSIGKYSRGGGGLPLAHDGDQPFSRKRSASEGSSSGFLLSSGRQHPRQDLPRAVSVDHVHLHVHGGDAAAARSPYGGDMNDMPAPVKREPSLACDVPPAAPFLAPSPSFYSTGGGGDDDMTSGSLRITGDMREKLSREESLLRAIEVVNTRAGGGNDVVNCEDAATELMAGVDLGDLTTVSAW